MENSQMTMPSPDSSALEALLNDATLEEQVAADQLTDEAEAEVLGQGQEVEAAAAPLSNRERAVRQAKGELNYHEEPPGSNCNKFSRYFGKGCQPWCADFVSWAFDSTGNRDHRLPWGNPSAVESIMSWAEAHGYVVSTPQRGDVFVIQAPGVSHCGLVQRVSGPRFFTIEGNTTRPGYGSAAIWVAEKWRPIRGFRFLRVPPR
jgi:hypothetical protein